MATSFDTPTDPNIPPSAWVERHAHLVRAGGAVLDVAAGHGRHTRMFLQRGCKVTAVDIDARALAVDPSTSGLEVVEADLEAEPWPFPENAFDAIVVTNYLHGPHFPFLSSSLVADGVLIFETFGQGNEALGRPRNPDFLLAPGELLEAFGATLQIVAYEHGVEHHPRPAVRQRLCAVKAETPLPLRPDDQQD